VNLRPKFCGRSVARINLPFSPPGVLVVAYALLIILGTLLLKLPFMTNGAFSWLDAIFTSASAVTVTGLALVDTGTHFTLAGQAVILVLIQLGGLGLMTAAVFVFTVLGMRLPLRHQLVLSEDLNHTNIGGLFALAGKILVIVLTVEAVGTVLLALRFIPDLGFWPGIWSAIFHSISAFNNAGFSLQPDSLTKWVGDPLINLVIPALFIVGGFGFTVILDISTKRSWHRLTLHSKLMIVGTVGLLMWAFLAILILEWSNPKTLAALDSSVEKLWATWFQAVTTRTAGFNTIDIAGLRDSTTLLFIPLMVIGAGPTSTGGGIKVTTFVVLMLATYTFLKRHQQISVFSRRIPHDQVFKVLALVTLSLIILLTASFIILISSGLPLVDVIFEVASAFGTVGLSRGITGELDPLSQITVVVVMFIGRVGPLALGFFLATAQEPRVRYLSEQVYLG
jgi:trk system potassium uptake protein TrkH